MDKESKGFIKLDRNIFDHWIFQDAEKFRAFVDLIQLARWKDEKLLIGNDVVTVPRGSYYTSELKLAERWKWSRKKTRMFLELLENESMIIKKGTSKGTMLTVENYRVYQDVGPTKDTTKEIINFRESNLEALGQEQGKKLDNIKERKRIEKGTTEDTTVSIDISEIEVVEGTTKSTTKEHQKDNEGYSKGTSKGHQKNNEGYTKEEIKEVIEIKEVKEREEGEEKATVLPPLSFQTKTHELIFNRLGEVTYRTWFIDIEIKEDEKQIVITVEDDFKKKIIESKFKDKLKMITGKDIVIKEDLFNV